MAVALSALLTLLPVELTDTSAKRPNGPHVPRHPALAQVLQFEASLVADLAHGRQFSNAEPWNRCVGGFLSLWFGGDKGAAAKFSETVRTHFQAIDRVRASGRSIAHLKLNVTIRQSTHLRMTGQAKKANCFAIRSSHLHMGRSFSCRTRVCGSSAVVGMVFSAPMVRVNLPLCANCMTERSRTSHLRTSCDVSWSNTRFRARTRRFQ